MSESDWVVRLWQEEDILPLYKAFHRQEKAHLFWERCRHLLKRFQEGTAYPVIALSQGKIIGRAHLIHYRQLMEIAELIVLPDYRRQGVATRLIETLLAVAQQRGIAEIEICTEEENVPALHLYQKLGFREKKRHEAPAPFPPYYQITVVLSKRITV